MVSICLRHQLLHQELGKWGSDQEVAMTKPDLGRAEVAGAKAKARKAELQTREHG